MQRWAFIVHHGDILEQDGQDGIIWGMIWHDDFHSFLQVEDFYIACHNSSCQHIWWTSPRPSWRYEICVSVGVPSVHYCMMHYSCSGDGWYEGRSLWYILSCPSLFCMTRGLESIKFPPSSYRLLPNPPTLSSPCYLFSKASQEHWIASTRVTV